MNNPTFRLINPTKQELGRVSKQKLEKIVKVVKDKSGLQLWKNTSAVITWFESLPNKDQLKFIQFDICEFYPSISEQLIRKAIQFAENYVVISDEDKNLFFHTKKSFLFNNKQPWIKKQNSACNVTMGSYDGAETCELVDLYLLSLLTRVIPNLGLYRDDGLAVIRCTARQREMLGQELADVFHSEGLRIEIKANKHSVDFLDVNLNLRNGEYKSYMKDNDTPLYVHSKSNHPKKVLENIPVSVNDRLSRISINKAVFDEKITPYQDALRDSGHNHTLTFTPTQDQPIPRNKKNRARKITWCNPPWNSEVKTNVGKQFLRIIDTSFPPGNPLRKLFNRNTVKVSYKCMPNMGSIISSHNTKLLQKDLQPRQVQGCNCRGGPDNCPLDPAECLKDNVIYVATVTSPDGVEHYTGLTGNTFKKRWYRHNSDFRKQENERDTRLSSHIWALNEENKPYEIKWKIMDRAPAFNPVKKKCRLCLKEIYYIIFHPDSATLNSRNELFNTCRHRTQKLLVNS